MWLSLTFLALSRAGSFQNSEPGGPVDFYGEVRPILAIRCLPCHGGAKPRGALALDRPEGLRKGGESGEPAVVPGQSGASALLGRLRSEDPERRMPPKGPRLSAGEVALLARWIDGGADWPADDRYWAFQAPRRPPVPPGAEHPIDGFIRSTLKARGLSPSAPADPRTLLRRLYLDLLGVGPTPREAEEFLGDRSVDAYARLVDRLLSDPRYGERWARHWLDLVRYAESDGFENDRVRPHAWRYRDYVIRSFNSDKPYDRFVREQIAGDELWPQDPDSIVATGFARLSSWDELCKNEKQRWQDFLNDATDTAGSVFLGLTVGCARCHDHKYDRITMVDYYAFQSFFAASNREVRPLPGDPIEPADLRAKLAALESAISPLEAERRRLWSQAVLALRRFQEGVRGPAPPEAPGDDLVRKWIDLRHPKRLGELDRAIREGNEAAEAYRPRAEAIVDLGPRAPATHILLRGALGQDGPPVLPAFIAALSPGGGPPEVVPPRGGASTGRRSALARWLGSASNPLVARVIVNRLWQHHFGRGLVGTPSDFGRNGTGVSHGELLDWLACELVDRGWSLKSIHRSILLSETYRQTSRTDPAAQGIDPENRCFWRMNRQRLEGEAIRDNVLGVSGRLSSGRGGPGVYPPVSPEVLVDLPNNDKLSAWGLSSQEDGRRRTIYVAQRRALMLPLVESFDGAEMNHTCPRRSVTTVASQALALFNGEFVRTEASHFADRVIGEAGDGRARQVALAYRLALSRPPSGAEEDRAQPWLRAQSRIRLETPSGTATGRVEPGARASAERMALVDFCHVLLNSNEFVYVD